MRTLLEVRPHPVALLILGAGLLDAILFSKPAFLARPDAAFGSALISETALLSVVAVLMRFGRHTIWIVTSLCALLTFGVVAEGLEAGKILLITIAGSAIWPLPLRLTGKQLFRAADHDELAGGDGSQSLRQWFLMVAVIGAWFVIADRLPGPIVDGLYFITTSVVSFLGVCIVLGLWQRRVWIPVYLGMLIACGFACLMISAEAAATMNWTATDVYGELAPIWSPIAFVETRLAHLRYFDMLRDGLTWLATVAIVQSMILVTLRWAGYRIVRMAEHDVLREAAP